MTIDGQTIVMVTHDLRLAERASRVVRLRSGALDIARVERASA